MRSHQVTIKDIARELGVSPSTVSRALKDHPDISPATKKQVRDLVEKLKYKPNAVALSLRSRKSNTIAVVVPEIVHHFFSSVISGIEDVAMDAGYNVMIFQSNEMYEREVLIIQALASNQADGVLVSISKTSKKFGHLKELMDEGLPLVFFDRACEEIEADKVIVDDFNGAFNAVEHLIRTGCKRIAHFSAPQHLQIGYQRKRGYISALEKNGIEPDEALMVKCDTMEEALKITPDIMRLENPPDAIFAVNDLTATGALKVLKQMRFRIPEDVSIIGFTDGLVAVVTDPPLTSVSQHASEIGKKAMVMLLKRIEATEEDLPAVT
ncbi:MAG: LacI family DNA-binding transcriptional regulator, partial [Bacteroidales bacterium]|nr:LacI family DNA-binding transcriptional regulator [Bacteroidales bacterium]